ncbi:MAG: integrase [Gemmatimonadales bacterium]|nr:integrase [Gemmatimonadales bacterium]
MGARPVQVCHEWNTAVHVADYEGRPERRPLTRVELQAFFDAADDRVEEAAASRRKGWLAAFRDATLFKVVYGWGLFSRVCLVRWRLGFSRLFSSEAVGGETLSAATGVVQRPGSVCQLGRAIQHRHAAGQREARDGSDITALHWAAARGLLPLPRGRQRPAPAGPGVGILRQNLPVFQTFTALREGRPCRADGRGHLAAPKFGPPDLVD